MRLLLLFSCLCGSLLFAQTNHAVSVTSNVFTPDSITIQVGDTVTWTNTQGIHNVNGSLTDYPENPEGFFSGGPDLPTWTYQFVFTLPGLYEYQCDPHVDLNMFGKVVVESAPPATVDSIVITEIMYNPPESGADSLEFFELYNIGSTAANLENWTTSQGVSFTFPAYSLEPGSFLILAGDEAAFRRSYNFSGDVFQWESGALSNGGEDIVLNNASGMVIDSVDYDNSGDWPREADGDGPSLVLCDVSADNADPNNWQAATNPTSTIINGTELLADPGALSVCGPSTDASISWEESQLTVDEGDEPTIFQIIATEAANQTFTVSLGDASTAIAGEDFSTEPSLPATFTVGDVAHDTFEITLTIVDDEVEEMSEFLDLDITAAGIVNAGDPLLTVTIQDDDRPVVLSAIDDINNLDAMGRGLSVGQTVTVQGVVHCLDFRAGQGLQFWIIEPNGDGINIFSFATVDDYVVTEGDELQITGAVEQFNGLLEIIPTDIEVLSMGNDLVAPEMVDAELSESLENRYISLYVASLVEENPIVRAGGGLNVNIIGGQSASDTLTLRVEDETNIDSTFLADFFTSGIDYRVTGLVSQRDFAVPFDDFYQLLPCSTDDFKLILNNHEPEWATEVRLFPNPVAKELNVQLPLSVDNYRLVDLHGRVIRSGHATSETLRIDLTELPPGMYEVIQRHCTCGRALFYE